MYLAHYGLREPPFSITPDPRFVFLSERHRDALAHLVYGVGQGGGSGFVQLTGEVGTGKTTISRLLLEQLPANARVALILNPLLSPVELLEAIGEELRLDLEGRRGSVKALVDTLNAHLLEAHAAGLRVVLIIDEAQNLSAAALEQVRLLTNLETSTQKLMQIILLGQPELREQLARPELRQLAQRITARYHLDPLDADESEAYLRHRWAIAGGGTFPFTRSAARRLHRHAGGIPRLLNVISERALLAGYARGERVVGERLLDLAAAEVLPPRPRLRRWLPLAVTTTIVGIVTMAVAQIGSVHRPQLPGAHLRLPVRAAAVRAPVVAAARPMPAPVGRAEAVANGSATAAIDTDQFTTRLAASSSDAQSAQFRLIAMWSLHTDSSAGLSGSSCPLLKVPGVFCASGRQRLSVLAQFDRPALLKLHTGNRAAWVVLIGLGSTQALVQLDDHILIVHRSALEAALDGYEMIGRGSPDLVPPLKHGDSGPGVEWLRQHLPPADSKRPAASSNSMPAPAALATYDDDLVAAVRGVQRDFGLHADGVIGPETLLALTSADRDGPHLRRLMQ